MYARHFFHLKQIQMRHTLLFGPIFVGAAIIALFLFLLNMTQPASEEQRVHSAVSGRDTWTYC